MCHDKSSLGRQCEENYYLELKKCVPCGDCETCARMLYIATAVFVLVFTLSVLFMSVDLLNHFFSIICFLQVPVAIRVLPLQAEPLNLCAFFSRFVISG